MYVCLVTKRLLDRLNEQLPIVCLDGQLVGDEEISFVVVGRSCYCRRRVVVVAVVAASAPRP